MTDMKGDFENFIVTMRSFKRISSKICSIVLSFALFLGAFGNMQMIASAASAPVRTVTLSARCSSIYPTTCYASVKMQNGKIKSVNNAWVTCADTYLPYGYNFQFNGATFSIVNNSVKVNFNYNIQGYFGGSVSIVSVKIPLQGWMKVKGTVYLRP